MRPPATYLERWPSRHSDAPTPLVCICRYPQREQLDGIWGGLNLWQCEECGRKCVD
jgi:hypothetical protein